MNGRPIYYSDVDKAYKTQFPGRAEGENEDQVQLRRLEVLRSLIDNELMLQRAEKAGLVATDADVDARLNELKAPYTKEEFDKQMGQWGLRLDELKARIRKSTFPRPSSTTRSGAHSTCPTTGRWSCPSSRESWHRTDSSRWAGGIRRAAWGGTGASLRFPRATRGGALQSNSTAL